MRNRELFKFICMSICVLTMFLGGCEKEKLAVTTEAMKNISGTWKIAQLVRNDEDLTQRIDLSKFEIVFNEDGTYTLVDKMAFVVDAPGTYSLDDPQYPFSLILTPQGEPNSKTIKFEFPVIDGERRLSLKLSMGCSSNTYQYVFEKLQ